MSIDVRLREDIAILTPKGVLTSAEESDELEEKIKALVEAGNRKSGIYFYDLSAGTFHDRRRMAVLRQSLTSRLSRGIPSGYTPVNARCAQTKRESRQPAGPTRR